jgi:hypothetical protein
VSSYRQEAPYPVILADLVKRAAYKFHEGWFLWLEDTDRGQGSKGLTLIVQRCGPDSYHPERTLKVNHYFPVPPAAFNERSWTWWLFQQLLLVERHEAMEHFKVDGRPVYPPAHGPGNDPYLALDYGSDIDWRTSFRGEVNA